MSDARIDGNFGVVVSRLSYSVDKRLVVFKFNERVVGAVERPNRHSHRISVCCIEPTANGRNSGDFSRPNRGDALFQSFILRTKSPNVKNPARNVGVPKRSERSTTTTTAASRRLPPTNAQRSVERSVRRRAVLSGARRSPFWTIDADERRKRASSLLIARLALAVDSEQIGRIVPEKVRADPRRSLYRRRQFSGLRNAFLPVRRGA